MVEQALVRGHTQEQRKIHAVRNAQRWGSLLASQCPTLGLDYRARGQVWRHIELARIYLPQLSTTHPNVAREAVRMALIQLIPPGELKELVSYYKREIDREATNNHTSDSFREKSRKGAQVRHSLHPTPSEALIRGRGREPWTLEEETDLLEMLKNPDYFYTTGGARRGFPKAREIAKALNEKYQRGRTPAAVGKYIHKRLQLNHNGNI